MSDPQIPPPDPDEVERDDEPPRDDPAIAGVGPALLTPPLPPHLEREADPDENDEDDDGTG